jgi:hypothetical protein
VRLRRFPCLPRLRIHPCTPFSNALGLGFCILTLLAFPLLPVLPIPVLVPVPPSCVPSLSVIAPTGVPGIPVSPVLVPISSVVTSVCIRDLGGARLCERKYGVIDVWHMPGRRDESVPARLGLREREREWLLRRE